MNDPVTTIAAADLIGFRSTQEGQPMSHTVSARLRSTRHISRPHVSIYDYARDLGQRAAAMTAAQTLLDAGIPAGQITADAESVPLLAPVAAVLPELGQVR